jgi:A/G-specific adenine glycosylase
MSAPQILPPGRIRDFRRRIYLHYRRNGRDLPWRKITDPYCIIVSEIMLQQTQVDRVVEKYNRFLDRFPDPASLAAAGLDQVLSIWQGLGYNRRARYLWLALTIEQEYRGIVPQTPEALATLPGIGGATAASITAFAFNKPVVFIETNIRTVFIHEFFPRKKPVRDEEIRPLVAQTLDRRNPRRWYNALMDYGVMLKKQHGNASRRSAHHNKQSPFEGSTRQVRGAIIRLLLQNPRISRARIVDATGHSPARVGSMLDALLKDKMITKRQGRYAIA